MIRWWMIILGFFGTIICYMDRSALSYAIGPIQHEFHLNNQQFGLLSAVFALGYFFMLAPSGILVDKFGARKIWGISAFLWSVATMLIGISTGIGMLLGLRLIIGLCEGPNFPAATKVVANWLAVKELVRGFSIILCAVTFSSVVGAPLSTYLIKQYNWRFMFIMLGGIGVIWSIVWWLVFRDQPQQSKLISVTECKYLEQQQNEQKSKINHKTSIKFLLTNRTFLINNYNFFTFGYILFFGVTWLPGYLEQTYHVALHELGTFLIFPWLFATVLFLCSGWLSDKVWQKTGSLRMSRSIVIGISYFIAGCAFIVLCFDISLSWSILFLTIAFGFGLMPNTSLYALAVDIAPDMAATNLGIMDSFLALSGILAPIITGYLIQKTGNFNIAFGIMFFLTMSSSLMTLLFQKPDQDLQVKCI